MRKPNWTRREFRIWLRKSERILENYIFERNILRQEIRACQPWQGKRLAELEKLLASLEPNLERLQKRVKVVSAVLEEIRQEESGALS